MKKPWSSRIIAKYVLLQMPALAVLVVLLVIVTRWIDLPSWFIWGLMVLWITKDIALFPLTWRAYDQDYVKAESSMVGARGIAEERLDPSGYIRIGGELWHAEVVGDAPPIERGEGVRVQGMHGLTLLVSHGNKKYEPPMRD
jgi:membrane protein implicated in regulation of membrane protease activity